MFQRTVVRSIVGAVFLSLTGIQSWATEPPAGVDRYSIEPPDVLSVNIQQVFSSPNDGKFAIDPKVLFRGINCEHVVQPDGTIELGPLGKMCVTGMTAETVRKAVEVKLAEFWPRWAFSVEIKVAKYNSKRVFVIVERNDGHDVVIHRIDGNPATTPTNVWTVLSKAAWQFPIDLAAAKISVHRPGIRTKDEDHSDFDADESLAVDWDVKSDRPTDETNYKLLPGDRIVVKHSAAVMPSDGRATDHPRFAPLRSEALQAPVVTPTPSTWAPAQQPPAFQAILPAPQASPEPPTAPKAAAYIAQPAAPAQQVLCRLQIIEDPQRNLETFAPLCKSGRIVGDSDSLLGAIRILEKNKLVLVLGQPTIVCTVGRSARFEVERAALIGETDERPIVSIQTTTVDISAEEQVGSLRFSLRMRIGEGEQSRDLYTSFLFKDRQTLIAKADAAAERPIYVVLTPERIKPFEPSVVQAAAAQPLPPAMSPPPPIAEAQVLPRFAPPHNQRASTAPQVMFDVTVVEDLSGSMTEFVPKENEFPCLLADTRTIRAALRILEKQELVRPISRPKVMAKADERATVQVGQEIPDQEKSFAGLKVNVLGRELGGGMAVEFELRQNDANANLGVSMSLVVPNGNSIVVRADKFPPNQQAQADASDDAPESGPKYPVYVVLTPTRVR